MTYNAPVDNGAEPRELVRELRIRMGSHDALARELGTSRQTVIRWERGAEPQAHYRERLAELTGRAAGDFVVRRPRPADRSLTALIAVAERIEAGLTRDLARLEEREQRVADQLEAQSQLLVELAAAAAEMREATRDLRAAANPARRRPA